MKISKIILIICWMSLLLPYGIIVKAISSKFNSGYLAIIFGLFAIVMTAIYLTKIVPVVDMV